MKKQKEVDEVSIQTKGVLTTSEAAAYMGVSKSYVYKLTMKRQIPHSKPMGKMCYFNRLELEQWLQQNRVATVQETDQKAQAYCRRKGGLKMSTPNIRYYAKMEYDTNSKKTLKYVITAQAGYYPPMEQIKGRNGLISMYLDKKLKEVANIPFMRLQAKNSLNFTGLKEYFIDGQLSGFAYGYSSPDKTYSGKKKENPFYEYKDDGYLFIVHQDRNANTAPEQIRPTVIELIVLDGAKVLISSYCKQLMMGGFDEAIKSLREQAEQVDAL